MPLVITPARLFTDDELDSMSRAMSGIPSLLVGETKPEVLRPEVNQKEPPDWRRAWDAVLTSCGDSRTRL